MTIDMKILELIQTGFGCDVLDAVMPLITRLGDGGILWIICSLLLVIFPKTRKAGMAVATGLVLEALCCNVVLKPLVARTRPYDVNSAVQLLIAKQVDYSFPSGHTAAAFAGMSALYFSKSRGVIPALVLSVLIAFSRLYLYVHYPTDILGGALLGTLAGWMAVRLLSRYDIWKSKQSKNSCRG